jgi:hypothetical protein
MLLTWMSVGEVLLFSRRSMLGGDSCICLVALNDLVKSLVLILCIYSWRYML